MKHILSISLYAAAATAMFSSCLFQEDDYFDDSAAIRIEKYNQQVKETLCASEYGWVMQYFANADSKGYNMFCKFNGDESVTIGSDHEYLRDGNKGKYTEDTSLYTISKDDGPMLDFNTWNDVLSVFSDPVDPETLVKDGKGLEGDHNFLVLSCSDDVVMLRGQRQSGEVRLVKINCTGQQYVDSCKYATSITSGSKLPCLYLVHGTDTLYVNNMATGYLNVGRHNNDPLFTYPYVIEPNGIYLQNNMSLEEDFEWEATNTHEFVFNADSSAFVSPDNSVALIPAWEMFFFNKITGDKVTEIDLVNSNAALAQAFDELSALHKSLFKSQSITRITFGTSNESRKDDKRTGVSFSVKSGSKTYESAFAAKFVQESNNKMRIEVDVEDYSGNIGTFRKNSEDLFSKFQAVASMLNGTYTFTPDSYFLPTAYTLVKDGDAAGNLIIKITK